MSRLQYVRATMKSFVKKFKAKTPNSLATQIIFTKYNNIPQPICCIVPKNKFNNFILNNIDEIWKLYNEPKEEVKVVTKKRKKKRPSTKLNNIQINFNELDKD